MRKVATLRSSVQISMAAQARRDFDARRRRETETRKLYGTARWKALRADQLMRVPLCEPCDKLGLVVPASVCDHVTPHRGDVERFWAGPFASLCETCHSSAKQREERRS